MLITREDIQGKMYSSPILSEYFEDLSMVVADIETTGLSPKNSIVMLGGVVAERDANRRAAQIFAASEEEEKELLERYIKWLSHFDIVITYNGQSFDLPFIRKRLIHHGLNTFELDRLYSLDLYRVVKYHSFLPELLTDLKQKSVEIYLGDSSARTDKIGGAENIKLYDSYKHSSGAEQENALSQILLHNRDDIVRLSDMLRLLQNLDFHEIMHGEGFPLRIGDVLLHVEKPKLKSGLMFVGGKIYGATKDIHIFLESIEFKLDIQKRSFELKVELKELESLALADTEALEFEPRMFDNTGGWASGYLVLKDDDGIRYQEVNLIIRLILQRIFGANKLF